MLLRGDVHDTKVIDVFRGELQSPAHLALSPFGKMPVLVTDDGPMIESTSIIEWLEERGPRMLIPPGQERIVRHFDRLADLYLLAPVSALWWRPGSEEANEAPEVARKAWTLFEARLEGRAFVAGDAISLGDLSGAIATDYLVRLGLEPPATLRAWMTRCFEIPAMKQSLDEAMPFIEPAMEMGRRQKV